MAILLWCNLGALPGAQVVHPRDAALLGSPISDVTCISSALQGKTRLLEMMGECLKFVFSHDAILLLRHSLAIPKLLYNIRKSPLQRYMIMTIF